MLHLLLILLKIIGIILALMLCLIFLILVIPIRYSFQMEKKEMESFQGRIRVTWFFALLYVKVSYIESVFDYRVRIAGYQILGNQESFLKRKEEKQKRKQEKQEKKDEKQRLKDEKQKEKQNQKEELTVQALPKSAEKSDSDDDIITTKYEAERSDAQKKENTEKTALKNSPEKKSSEGKQGKEKPEKKKNFFAKIKKTVHSAGEKISSLKENVNSFKDLYVEYHGGELLLLAKESIIKLVRHILPRRLKGSLRFGFDDPAATGILTGAAAIFYPKYQKHFQLEPDFQESCVEADCEGGGRIRPGFFLILVIRLALKPDVRKCIKLM